MVLASSLAGHKPPWQMSKSKPEMIMTRSLLSVSVAVFLMAGCVPVPATTPIPDNSPAGNQSPAPVTAPTSTPTPADTPEVVEQLQPAPQNQEILRALSQLMEIRDELKLIRNSVEELQFESENNKRRRQDLYQDVDRRLLDIERNQRVINERLGMVIAAGGMTGEGTGTAGTSEGEPSEEEWGMIDIGPSTGAEEVSATPVTSVLVVDGSDQTPQIPGENLAGTAVPGSDVSSSTASPATVSLEEQNEYDQAYELLKQSRYQDFILAVQQFVNTWPTSQLADDAWYWMAEAYYVNREFEHALNGFRTVVASYPDSQRVPEALLKTGYIQYDIGAYDEAAEIFRDILVRFPGHNVTISAQTRLRRIENTIQ